MVRFCELAEREIPSFGGIKFTSGDLVEGSACLKPGRTIFMGANTILNAALASGFDSAILVSLNVCPELPKKIFNAMQEQRFDEARALQNQLTHKFNECGTAIKAEFNRINRDIDCGPTRKPAVNLNQKIK